MDFHGHMWLEFRILIRVNNSMNGRRRVSLDQRKRLSAMDGSNHRREENEKNENEKRKQKAGQSKKDERKLKRRAQENENEDSDAETREDILTRHQENEVVKRKRRMNC
jgi:hypothetical protein